MWNPYKIRENNNKKPAQQERKNDCAHTLAPARPPTRKHLSLKRRRRKLLQSCEWFWRILSHLNCSAVGVIHARIQSTDTRTHVRTMFVENTQCSYHYYKSLNTFSLWVVFIELYFYAPVLHLLLHCSLFFALIVCMLFYRTLSLTTISTHNFIVPIK